MQVPTWPHGPLALRALRPVKVSGLVLSAVVCYFLAYICACVCERYFMQVHTWPSNPIRPYGLSSAHFLERSALRLLEVSRLRLIGEI